MANIIFSRLKVIHFTFKKLQLDRRVNANEPTGPLPAVPRQPPNPSHRKGGVE